MGTARLAFTVLGRIGYRAFDIDPHDDDIRNAAGDSSSSDLFYGVGGQFDFTHRLSLRAQHQRYEFGGYGDPDEIGRGLRHTFQYRIIRR